MNIEIQPKRICKSFIYIILILLAANVLGIVSKFYFGHDYVFRLVPLFDFNLEINIPTLYSSFALIFCSILLAIIASIHKKQNSSYYSWIGLSIIFLFLSVDEIVSIHERLVEPVRESLNTSGFLYNAWVIPYGIFVAVFVIAYFRFFMNLAKRIRKLFAISGTTFVTGALGFELLGGRQNFLYGRENLTFAFLYTCEELLEMLGIVIFIYALLIYLAEQFKPLTVSLTERE